MLPLPSLEIFIYCLETSVIPEHYSIFKLHVLLQYSLVERIPVIDTLAVAMTYRPLLTVSISVCLKGFLQNT